MPVYQDESVTVEKLYELRQLNKCLACGGILNVFLDQERGKAFLACNDWPRSHHEGIEREASRYEREGLAALNIPTRREIMAEQIGEKAISLMKYEGVISLTRVQAMEILKTIWPRAPEVEVLKAALICQQYGLNPLMKHLYLIPFKRREKGMIIGEDWAVVLGINTPRLLAQRRHHYSYLDLSPRLMNTEEQMKILGELDDSRIWAITKIKDLDTGAEVMGIGSWPKDEVPYGAEKGNTKLNMACIRSERQALDRQYPGEMPQGVEVIDEQYTPPDLIRPEGDEIIGEQAKEAERVEKGGQPAAQTIISSPKGQGEIPARVPASESAKIQLVDNYLFAEPTQVDKQGMIEGEGFRIDFAFLKEAMKSLNWTDETCKSFLAKFKVNTKGTLIEVIKRLNPDQAETFTKELSEKLANVRML